MREPFDILLEFINEKIWLAIMILPLYLRSCPKRNRFVLKAVLGCVALLVLGLLPSILTEFYPQSAVLRFWNSREQFIWPVLMTFYLGTMFRSSWNMNLFAALAGLCTQEVMYGLWSIFSTNLPALGTLWMELLFCIVVGSGLTVALYFFMGPKLTTRSLQVLEKRSLIPLIVLYLISVVLLWHSTHIVVFMMLGFETLQTALVQAGIPLKLDSIRWASIYSAIAGNIMVLLALRNMLQYSESDLERELLEQIREQDRKQYDRFRSNVDYINTKSHDLKHYLELIRNHETIPKEEFDQVSDSLLHLDAETDSGNETLDLILTDRRLACESQQIELIFQTDGTHLEQLDVIDTYAVFCNILDNAIGYVKELPPQDRSIRLGIRTIHNMVFIHQENPFVGTLEMKDGLPVTTREDETLHGFGLKSVQNTVKKRKGELIIRAENGRFELDICFPGE